MKKPDKDMFDPKSFLAKVGANGGQLLLEGQGHGTGRSRRSFRQGSRGVDEFLNADRQVRYDHFVPNEAVSGASRIG
jgi:hypothetical protein